MRKKYIITSEEFEAIKEAIISALRLWQYEFIGAESSNGDEISMRIDIFFDGLKDEFIIKD